jgi:hypothetical protein
VLTVCVSACAPVCPPTLGSWLESDWIWSSFKVN